MIIKIKQFNVKLFIRLAGTQGIQGPQGISVINLDGGLPDTIFGGVNPIDCGGVI